MNITRFQKIFGVGLLGFLIAFFMLGILWLVDNMYQQAEILSRPGPLRVIGAILLGIWVCWHYWCFRTIRHWWTEDQLCTKGPYRFVRHPMYAGGVYFFGLGVALICNSWIILLWPIAGYAVWYVLVRREEGMMTAVFGEEYRRYSSQTGRLFPRFFK
jgi:protein-S-isoprenylcysteine O-methyltransferase Ste14